MGNTVSGSKDRQADESVDFGALVPQGLYTGPQDWNQQVVGHLIVERKLAPFYRPLVDYEEDWDEDQILAARKEAPEAPPPSPAESSTFPSSTSSKFHRNPHKAGKEPFRPTEASIYKGAVECPICFLYYPSNINRSRCCDQAICTECFVQIKRAEPTTTHLVSEPVACPYCVQENFGVTYEPPPWRTGLMSDAPAPSRPNMLSANSASSTETNGSRRRKSFGADSPEVVTIDQIRPDWEAKLAAVRAAAARRANRRIIMRQVGDRLIPIGITSGRTPSGEDGVAVTADGPENGSARRSSRRRNHNGQDLNQIFGSVGLGGLGGQDLEELMVMEAMRLSLLEHEEQQRRQANSNNESSGHARTASGDGNDNSDTPVSSADASPRLSISPSTRPAVPRRRSPSPGLFSGTSNTLLQPPSARAHRRIGSSPGSPSSTLSAALSAAQTAMMCLDAGAEGAEDHDRHMQGAPRSAPESRAAIPRPVGAETYREGAWRAEPRVLPQVLTIPGPADASSSTNAPSYSPGSAAETPQSDVGEDGALQNREEYKPLASSVEAGDPLLDWNR